MTREEAIAYGKRVIDLGLNDETQAFCNLAISALSIPERETGTDLEEIVKEIKRERAYRENRHEIEEVCEVDVILRIIEPYMRESEGI